MPAHTATVDWTGDGGDFLAGRYSRAHTIRFDGGTEVAGSASPANVPLPFCVEAAVDPEEMLVAALSACHMLWFLNFARRSGAEVQSYRDTATGEIARDAKGRPWVGRVTLRPQVRFADPVVAPALLDTLHHQAHEACFIANSVRSEVLVEPVRAPQEERRHG